MINQPEISSEVLYFLNGRIENVTTSILRPLVYLIIHRREEVRLVGLNTQVGILVQKFLENSLLKPVRWSYRHHGSWLTTREISTNFLTTMALFRATVYEFFTQEFLFKYIEDYFTKLSYWEDEGAGVKEMLQLARTIVKESF
jgi:hypothetical protein